MKITKHAKKQKKKRKIQIYKVINAFLKGKTLMRCPYTARYILSHKDTTVVLCPEKKTVITTYSNDYCPPAKLADVVNLAEFRELRKKLNNTEPPKDRIETEVELTLEQYLASGKKKAA